MSFDMASDWKEITKYAGHISDRGFENSMSVNLAHFPHILLSLY